jgi:LCP family protein required for cell wall assembly
MAFSSRTGRALRVVLLVLVGLAGLAAVAWALLQYQLFDSAPALALPGTSGPRARGTIQRPSLRGVQRRADDTKLLRFSVVRAKTPPLSRTTNILLAGVDSRGRGKLAGRTDALLVVVLDRRSRHLGLVSIPRDLLVNVPGHDRVRINTVYLHGLRDLGGPAAAAKLLRETVHDLLGLPIHHHVFIDQAGFERLIDGIGGLEVQVRCAIHERFLDATSESGHRDLSVGAGVQRLDGRSALLFARARHGRGVIDRNRRQQAVLVAIRARLARIGVSGLVALAPLLSDTVYTDLGTLKVLRLARRLLRVKRSHLHGLLLRARHAPASKLDDGRWVMIPKQPAIHADLKQLFSRAAPGKRETTRPCPPMDAGFRARRRQRKPKRHRRR